MPTTEELRARLQEIAAKNAAQMAQAETAAKPPVPQATAAPASAESVQKLPLVAPAPTVADTPVETPSRIFHHPVAGSTTIMPSGKVLVFVGHISGQGDRRVVGEGIIETSETDEIAWLESVAKMRSNQVTEIKLSAATGGIAGVMTPKSPNPLDAKVLQEATANSAAVIVDPENKNFTAALVTGTAADTNNGQNPLPIDTSVQVAMAAAEAAGDLTKPGTVHNPNQ